MPSVLMMYRVVLTVVVGIASVGTESVGIVSASRHSLPKSYNSKGY